MQPRWLRRIISFGKARDEIAEELSFHVALEVERLEAQGFNRLEAERIALESFGDVDAIERECRRIRGGLAEAVACEIRSAVQSLATEPRSTITAFLGLAAALALFAVAFSVFEAAVLRPLPYPGGDRVMRLWSSVPGIGPEARWGLAKGQFQLIARESRSFSEIGLYSFKSVTTRAVQSDNASRAIAM